MRLVTGCRPDTRERRDQDAIDCPFSAVAGAQADDRLILQRVPWLMDQKGHPSCVGHAFAGRVNGFIAGVKDIQTASTTIPPPSAIWASGISIWRDARRRMGRLEDVTSGVRLQYAVDSLVYRGWDDYEAGEEETEILDGQDDFLDEAWAASKRAGEKAERYRITGKPADRRDQLLAALSDPRNAIVGSWYLHDAFGDLIVGAAEKDVVVTDAHVGGRRSSHAMGIAGASLTDGRWRFWVVNQWRGKGGAHLPDGTYVGRTYWFDEGVVCETEFCHDLWVVQPKV